MRVWLQGRVPSFECTECEDGWLLQEHCGLRSVWRRTADPETPCGALAMGLEGGAFHLPKCHLSGSSHNHTTLGQCVRDPKGVGKRLLLAMTGARGGHSSWGLWTEDILPRGS